MKHTSTPVTRWLREARGAMSQAELVADIEAVTGWRLPRENYSKYETGALSPEPTTLARFVAYHATYSRPGPDFTPEPVTAPATDPMERIALALESIAGSLSALRVDMSAAAGSSAGSAAAMTAQLGAILERMPVAR